MSTPAKRLTATEAENAYRWLAGNYGDDPRKRADRLQVIVEVIPPGDLGREVMRRARATDTYWPSEARWRHLVSEVIAELTPPPAPPSRAVEGEADQLLPTNPVVAALAVKLGREFLAQPVPGGDRDEINDLRAQVIAGEWLDTLGHEPPTNPPTVLGHACQRCGGVKMLAHSTQRDAWLPCPLCNREAFTRWQGGHYRANHQCAECAPAPSRRGGA